MLAELWWCGRARCPNARTLPRSAFIVFCVFRVRGLPLQSWGRVSGRRGSMLAWLQVRLCMSHGAPNGQEHSMRLNPSRTLKNARCHLRMQTSLVITIDAGTGRVGAENGKIRRVRSSLEGEGPRRSGQERKRLVY